jgi:hypothetical protein
VIESGFHRIPLARRAEAFRMNDRGWAEQMKNIERYVAGSAAATGWAPADRSRSRGSRRAPTSPARRSPST